MGRRGIGELERAVMQALWISRTPMSVRDVATAVGDDMLAYTTVMTVLDRLARKGTVLRERDGRAWAYRAAGTQEQFIAELMRDALDLAGDRDAALVRFAHLVSGEEAHTLRSALDVDGQD